MLEKLNQNSKINKSKLEIELETIRNTENYRQINDIMNDQGKVEDIDRIKRNKENQKKMDDKHKIISNILDSGNKYDEDIPNNEEDYLNSLLFKNGAE